MVRASGSYPLCPGFKSLHRHQIPGETREIVSVGGLFVSEHLREVVVALPHARAVTFAFSVRWRRSIEAVRCPEKSIASASESPASRSRPVAVFFVS